MIKVGSKCRIKGRKTKGVSFKVLSIDKYGNATVKNSVSKLDYIVPVFELELMR